jgi:hypothetical protein
MAIRHSRTPLRAHHDRAVRPAADGRGGQRPARPADLADPRRPADRRARPLGRGRRRALCHKLGQTTWFGSLRTYSGCSVPIRLAFIRPRARYRWQAACGPDRPEAWAAPAASFPALASGVLPYRSSPAGDDSPRARTTLMRLVTALPEPEIRPRYTSMPTLPWPSDSCAWTATPTSPPPTANTLEIRSGRSSYFRPHEQLCRVHGCQADLFRPSCAR